MLTRPLYPDEWINGYRGHLIYLNDGGWALYRYLRKRINASGRRGEVFELEGYRVKSLKGDDEAGFADQLQRKSAVDKLGLALLHSLAPIHLLLDRKDRFSGWASGSYITFTPKGQELLKPAREKAYLCAECIKEDMVFWGGSYWRRSHQIPGVHSCGKHGKQLRRVAMKLVDRLPPDRVLDGSEEAPDYEGLAENETVKVFIDLANIIFDEGLTLNTEVTWESLCEETLRQGIDMRGRRFFEGLITHVSKAVPSAWFDELPFHETAGKPISGPGRGLTMFLNDPQDESQPQAYLLIAAWLFGSTDAALDALYPIKVQSLHKRLERPQRPYSEAS